MSESESNEWGSLNLDRAYRSSARSSSGSLSSSSRSRNRDADAGTWPEDMDVRFVADSSMTLPGMSSRPESCGVYYPSEFCPNCGEPSFGKSNCERRVCPNCWWRWRENRSESITVRLQAARHAAEDGSERRLVHTVASPPEGDLRTLVDVKQGFSDAYELAKERGVRGGVCLFHGYRVKSEYQDIWESEVSDDWDGGIWSWVRENDEWGWWAMVYWSPHYHIIGLAEEIAADTGDDGWRFRRIRSLERYSLRGEESYEDCIGLASYLLSHLAFESDSSSDSVRWFGELATTKFSPEKEVSDGSLSVIRRMTDEVQGRDVEDDEEGVSAELVEEIEEEVCDVCGAPEEEFRSIWKAGRALQDREFIERIGSEQEHRLSVAFEWAIGEIDPPPGMDHPMTESAAREAFERML